MFSKSFEALKLGDVLKKSLALEEIFCSTAFIQMPMISLNVNSDLFMWDLKKINLNYF